MHIFTAGQMLTAPSPIRGYGYVTAGWILGEVMSSHERGHMTTIVAFWPLKP